MIYDLRFKKTSFVLYWFFLIFVFLIFIGKVNAAIFSFDSQTDKIRLEDEFKIDLMLDTERQEINAVEGKILFPSDILEVKQISDGNSIINLWVIKPAQVNNQGEIIFSGIIPGGYNGYLGAKPILSVVFKTKNSGGGQISLSEAEALLNDGLGTPASVSTAKFIFSISESAPPSAVAPPDQERPEPFIISISKDGNIYDGKWFAVFATQDKKSGVDYYEVAEDKKNVGTDYKKLNWHKAASPYVLNNQSLQDYVYVKAIDNQGNERVAVLFPRHVARGYKNYLFWGIIVLLVISLLRGIWRKKKTIQQD